MNENTTPILIWFRRDLRLSDHPALSEACASGRPVIPVFIHDETVSALGAAPKFRLGLGLEALQASLAAHGSRLILRRGPAIEVLCELIDQTGAGAVCWSRLYDPTARERDSRIKSDLKQRRIEARSHPGHLLFEPWTVETRTGGFYRVYSPMWRAVAGRDVGVPLPAPDRIPAPQTWPDSDRLQDWNMEAAMGGGASIVAAYSPSGEAAALDRLDQFTDEIIAGYKTQRDMVAIDGTSRLSDHLALGEISPRRCWAAARRAGDAGAPGAETFCRELVWREFAYHLMYHTPHILHDTWREDWRGFPWNTDADLPQVVAWKQATTGVPFVDAALREMYVTGKMHNRARMIVASYLTKHLLTDWRIGMGWFEQHLTDWDPASNAMGWQWVAGCGPDAAPYFRIFNPVTQQQKFDPDNRYVDRWIAEGRKRPAQLALSYFEAVPRRWGLDPSDSYPDPVVDLAQGRERALAAYQNWRD